MCWGGEQDYGKDLVAYAFFYATRYDQIAQGTHSVLRGALTAQLSWKTLRMLCVPSSMAQVVVPGGMVLAAGVVTS